MKRRMTLYALTVLTATVFAFRTDLKTERYTGYAYEEGTKKLIYTEEFTDKFVNGKHTESLTQYFDPKHTLIAERKMDFTHSKNAPNFKTEDLRTGYVEGAEVDGNQVRLFFREDKNSELEEKTFKIPAPVVVDGGFNKFIKDNWEKLQTGDAVTFNFTVSARLNYYTLRASKSASTDSTFTVRVEPDKAVFRWLTSPIIIEYDAVTKRINSYKGKSNISDAKGNNFMTTLIYPDKGP